MIRYVYAKDLVAAPLLAETMFRDRATQFRARLGWDVSVDVKGHERDEYDAMNPLYAIWQQADGTHGGSMRFLPTTGDTMVNDHFRHLTNGDRIESSAIWECTRFCLSPHAAPQVSAILMLAGLELGLGQGLGHAVGVFDARMVRIYRSLGWEPKVLGTQGTGRDAISVGLWEFAPRYRSGLLARAGLTGDVVRYWYEWALGYPVRAMAEAA
jgi:acyl homoserine lactone synthase